LACGGCYSCRYQHCEPYAKSTQIYLNVARLEPSADHLSDDFKRRVGERRILIVDWDGPREIETLKRFDTLLINLVGAGIQQFILPPALLEDTHWTTTLVKQLAQHRQIPHRVIPHRWLLTNDARDLIYPLPTLILYPPNDDESDSLYLAWQKWQAAQGQSVWVIHAVYHALYLPSQHGKFLDRVDGISENAQKLQEWLKRSQTSLFF
jgi:hypothetical protein